ncbi:MAG: type 1 glutamine amidotransferase, partial [Halobacteriales archaeon]|nr:type 1 glutamine amidotransferase [Halobacteriales archaeon]
TSRNFRRELDADLAEFRVTDGELPAGFDYDGVVVTGSKASVYWDEPWIDDLLDWTAEAVDRGLPHLGVCYGHQVLAEALGGTVEHMGDYEIGYHEVRRVGESTLLGDLPERFVVFTTHQDAVTELPPGAEPIAENEYSNHGFERGDVFTVQFHPEYDRGTAESVTRGKDLDDATLEAALDSITDENYAAACEAKRLFDAFTRYVNEERADPPRTA